ncbi:MAG TPA: MotA/TolQ/ExbB proton channel family protein [bacterium (Candidatus Stahlbacteria)]|nr:MotA/TolQ/ExbB proton channel family protein [Candidatus Stahlbacteria bacterium]
MILGQSIVDIFKGSFIMVLLLVASIVVVALVVERFLYFARNGFDARRLYGRFRQVLRNRGPRETMQFIRRVKNPVGGLLQVALENNHLPPDELGEILYSFILEEKVKFDRYLGGLGTMANAATLLGLLGTVIGLIRAFHNIAMTGSGGPAVVSAGIAEALLTTAFGLFIGIPALFFYNYFTKKSNDLATQMESTLDKVVVLIQQEKKKAKENPREPEPMPEPEPLPKREYRPRTDETYADEGGWKF